MATDLLSLPLKGTSSADLEQGLLLFISTSYSHEQAEQLRGAVGEVHALRERVRALTLSEASVEEAVGSLGRYAKLITSMSSRFGTAIDDVLSGTDAQLELTWRDAHRPKAKCTLHQLGFERACALYNLGAALSYRATTRNTSDSDGLRAACQDLQQAAGALEAAGGAVAGAPWSLDKRMTADISAAALEGKRALMLAQAQRCFYERAKRDQMKGGVVAKLAAASASFYDEAASKLRAVRDVCAAGGGGDVSPPERERGGMMNKTKEKTGRGATPGAAPAPLLALVCVSEAGARMFDAWAQWHCAAEHEESHEYGPQVARLQRAVELAAEAMAKLAAGGVPPGGSGGAAGAAAVPPEVSRAFAEAEATIRASEATASKHNTHVYHERVPPVSALPAPIPKAIVKATPPAALAPPADASADVSNGAVDASQGDPFARLVPLTVLTDASVYTASLDDVLRQMSDRLQDIEQTSAGELASMDLPGEQKAGMGVGKKAGERRASLNGSGVVE
jgi:programmed cell death 6-interacting protein